MWQLNYDNLSITDKKQFSDAANKLLAVNFLVKSKPDNANMYYFVSKNIELFTDYFAFIDWELDVNTGLGVVSLKNTTNRNRLNLKLNETITLLIIRLLYEQNSDEVNIDDHVEIKVSDIHEMYAIIGLESRILTKTAIIEILSLFRRFNLLEIESLQSLSTSDSIYILPSILLAVETSNIFDVYKKLHSFGATDGGDAVEETKED